jgi:putative inorganic carbon (hco3(-)) transporter
MSALLPEPGALDADVRAEARAPARSRHNWPLYALVAMLPLQNIHLNWLPSLGAGLNFINITFALAVLVALARRGSVARVAGLDKWLYAYIAWSVVSLLIGYGRVGSETEDHLMSLKDHLIAVLLFFVVQRSTGDALELRRVMAVTLLPLLYVAKAAWVQQQAIKWHYDDALRVQGTFSLLGANEFAAFCITVALVCLALLFVVRERPGWRIALLAALGCMLFAIVFTYSRAGYIALAVGVVLLFLLWRHRWKLAVPLLLLGMVLPSLLPQSVYDRFDSITLEEGKRDDSTDSRFRFWAVALDVWQQHPVEGIGYHTFHHREFNPYKMDTHNFFIRELAEKGLVGGIIIVGLFFAMWRALRRVLSTARPGGWAQGLALGMLGALAAMITGCCFGDRFTYYPMISYFWVYFALTLRAWQLEREEAGERTTTRSAAVEPLPHAGLA